MEINIYLKKYKNIRYNFFKWRYELELIHKLSLAFCFACLTGLFAQLRFYIPWTPVPITGQVFAVVLAGVLLGKWGGISQFMYIGVGIMGVPWFAGFNSGLLYLTGPTGGYLIGFVAAASFIGYMIDRYIVSRKFLFMLFLILFSTFVLIYIPGLIQFYLWGGASIGIWELLTLCVIPFIFLDIIKSLIAAIIATALTPKKAYGGELDI